MTTPWRQYVGRFLADHWYLVHFPALDVGSAHLRGWTPCGSGWTLSDLEWGQDVTCLPYERRSFQFVKCTDVLYLTRFNAALREIHRVLEVGGHVLITVPVFRQISEERDRGRPSASEWRRHLIECGFGAVTIVSLGGWWSCALQLVADRFPRLSVFARACRWLDGRSSSRWTLGYGIVAAKCARISLDAFEQMTAEERSRELLLAVQW